MSSYAKLQREAKHYIVMNDQPFAAARFRTSRNMCNARPMCRSLVSPPLPASFSLGLGSSLSRYVIGQIAAGKFVRWLLKRFQIGREFLQAQRRPLLQSNVVPGNSARSALTTKCVVGSSLATPSNLYSRMFFA
jgi:hypothetical protein